MLAVLLPISALFLAVAVLVLGHGLTFSLLPLYMTEAGFPTEIPGYLAAAYFAGLVIGAMVCPAVIRAVGHIRAFAGFAALLAAITLLFALWTNPWFWIGIRVIYGLSNAGVLMSIESWLSAAAPNYARGRILALYLIVFYGAMGSGQFLLNLFPVQGFELFSLAAVLFTVGLVPVALSQVRAPVLEAHTPLSLRGLIAVSPLGLVAAFGAGLGQGAAIGLLPVWAVRVDGPGLAPLVMATLIYGGLVLQWPVGWLSDLFDRRTVIIFAAAVATVAALAIPTANRYFGDLIPLFDGHLPMLLALLLFGGLLFALYSLSLAHAVDFLPEGGDMVSLSSGLIMANSVGAMIGPLIAAQVFELGDGAGLFLFCAVATAATGVYGFYRTTRRAAVPNEDQGDYVASPSLGPGVYELDPRAEEEQIEFDFDHGYTPTDAEVIDVDYEPVEAKPPN